MIAASSFRKRALCGGQSLRRWEALSRWRSRGKLPEGRLALMLAPGAFAPMAPWFPDANVWQGPANADLLGQGDVDVYVFSRAKLDRHTSFRQARRGEHESVVSRLERTG